MLLMSCLVWCKEKIFFKEKMDNGNKWTDRMNCMDEIIRELKSVDEIIRELKSVDEIIRELKSVDEIKRKWWAIVQK